MSDITYTKLRGNHERIGRHETPPPEALITFASHITEAEREAFRREWPGRFVPSGSVIVTSEQPSKSLWRRLWESYNETLGE